MLSNYGSSYVIARHKYRSLCIKLLQLLTSVSLDLYTSCLGAVLSSAGIFHLFSDRNQSSYSGKSISIHNTIKTVSTRPLAVLSEMFLCVNHFTHKNTPFVARCFSRLAASNNSAYKSEILFHTAPEYPGNIILLMPTSLFFSFNYGE